MADVAIVAKDLNEFFKILRESGLQDADLVLWAPDFSRFAEAATVNVQALGDGIGDGIIDQATCELHATLANWYRDEEGNDLSQVSGVSLGLAFESTLEELFYNLVRVFLGLQDLTNRYDQIVVNGGSEPVIALVAWWLIDNEDGRIHILDLYEDTRKKGMQDHPFHGMRDLSFTLTGSRIDSLMATLLMSLQWGRGRNVLVMDAGKFENYLIGQRKRARSFFRFLVPVRRRWTAIVGHRVYWQRVWTGRRKDGTIDRVRRSIDTNGWTQRTEVVPSGLFRAANEHFVLPYWDDAFVYYRYYQKLFKKHRPKLAIFGTDGFINHVLCAYAAKNVGVKTAMMPHGVHIWGASNIQGNEESPFDKMLAVGYCDELNYRSNGIPNEKIVPAKLPWFSQSNLLRSEPCSERFSRRVMLLPLDAGFSLGLTPTVVHRHLLEMIQACEKLGLDIYGIKFRGYRRRRAWGLKEGRNRIFGRDMHVLEGYGNLSDYFKDIDLVIGPFCSAVAECSLSGVDFYTYFDEGMYNLNPNIHKSFSEILYYAQTPDELVENVGKKRVFRPGYGPRSLVNVAGSFDDACAELDQTIAGLLEERHQCQDA